MGSSHLLGKLFGRGRSPTNEWQIVVSEIRALNACLVVELLSREVSPCGLLISTIDVSAILECIP